MVSGVHHTGFTVKDVDRSLAFYRDLLGLELVARQGGTEEFYRKITGYPDADLDIAVLKTPDGSFILELIAYRAPAGVSLDVKRTCNPGSGHLAFLVEDLPTRYEELRAKGVQFISDGLAEVTSGAFKGGYGLYCVDPDGIPVELIQAPAQK